ncbi:hypothetical protein AKO1_004256 [Acrasis kona]|uniref:histidine kinase n=1 Tax=Acrasis kona TaxID=1008807 RepID=A0AAW2Z8Z8_9EUKA
MLDLTSKRLWFKSKVGFEEPNQVDLENNIMCLHTCSNLNEDKLMVQDCSGHNIFYDNPFVKNGLNFYAGVPLITPGGRVGTLCVLDSRKKELDQRQIETLQRLSRQIVYLMEFKVTSSRMTILQERNVMLQSQLEEKTHVLGVVSHDIRQPLTSITASSEMLLMNKDLDASQTELVRNNLSSAKYISSLVGELLEVVKYDTYNNNSDTKTNLLELEMVEMVTFIQQILMKHAMSAKKKNIFIKFGVEVCPPDHCTDDTTNAATTSPKQRPCSFEEHCRRSILWWDDSDDSHNLRTLPVITCFIDQVKMEQVVNNLISNAVKFSAYDSTCEVLIGRKDDSRVFVSVKDYGQGIPEQEIHKLFKPFEKIAGVKPTGGESSTGLGLNIVKNIIDAHQGKINVLSIVGEGSTFTITLPTHSLPCRIPQPIQSTLTRHPTQPNLNAAVEHDAKKLNILIADDYDVNRSLIVRIF